MRSPCMNQAHLATGTSQRTRKYCGRCGGECRREAGYAIQVSSLHERPGRTERYPFATVAPNQNSPCAPNPLARLSRTFRAACSFRRCSWYETQAASVANISPSDDTFISWGLSPAAQAIRSKSYVKAAKTGGAKLPTLRNRPIGH